jgi:protein TonB
MFETSRPQFSSRGRWLFYETLPVSIALHAIVIVAFIVSTVWKVEFPRNSPKMYLAFQLSDAPPPPPPPPRAVAKARATPVLPQAAKPPDEIVAPSIVPEAIPIVENEIVTPLVEEAPGAVEGGVDGGIDGGQIGGVIGGVIGSVVTPDPAPGPPGDGRVHVGRDVPLDLPIVSQVYPSYPSDMATRGIEDTLVVRYIIGKDGRIKDVILLEPPKRKEFEKPTLRAIRLWRFRPMVRDGERVEVEHELTVRYRLVAKG